MRDTGRTFAPADVRSLNGLAEMWRLAPDGTRRFVPGFDAHSGGVESQVLVLMESPGPATIAVGAGAICSEDNPGPTVAAFRRARAESGLPRTAYLRWNIVPWELARRPTRADLVESIPALSTLLASLPQLAAIVTFGATALDGVMRYLTMTDAPTVLPVIAAPHPSPANGRHRAEQHLRAVNALRVGWAIAQRSSRPL
ncbi:MULTISPECIES: uracil-DNA glycosylase family protein [Curtobacterium]|uniref:uracil-DNA glycosylase family protein n=1 Tax=Curtobacterium TaxID=2034 RepID=UPI000FAA201C|nr:MULTISPECIES: uracil-DNA glycosylase family protein [Curtobacterium]MBT1631681.1 uracil-DNA glycosylase [Curtobacterium flaccumfaciens pv. oortii]MCX2844195.1 uracil-DNA glycosylase [Curtobacterium flaccumfaciens pv. oortii]ROQ04986.1 uracil DNA glycosylase superfamily protein [Curtobacterium sp. PhB171]ROQ22187.1 uracil DNA glycosylase superfamily protein [Curtobacterium sp. PhB170]ROS33547.1 uracil DNA glycosylase superfamily protein [Curtobacterium sp. PhB131]